MGKCYSCLFNISEGKNNALSRGEGETTQGVYDGFDVKLRIQFQPPHNNYTF